MLRQNEFQSIECTEMVPLHWVRANQIGILTSIIIATFGQMPWVLIIPLVVQLCGRYLGVKYNAFVRLLAPWLPASTRTEARELLRFNNLLAILFLCGIMISYALGSTMIAYIITGMLTAAVILALSGFCLGCFMYFQYKQFIARRRLEGM